MSDFNTISTEYQRRAHIQKAASAILFDLLDIQRDEDVLDLGCGPGGLTRAIRNRTEGVVWGVDASAGMIAEARRACAGEDIVFVEGAAASFSIDRAFDVIFCNSAFQWFRDVEGALRHCLRALRPGGRMGIQAPGGSAFCPNFIRATESVRDDPRTRATWARFRSPWFFPDSIDDYVRAFESAGFVVERCWFDHQLDRYSPEKAIETFESGAAAGYLNPDCYDGGVAPAFIETARSLIHKSLRAQAEDEGRVPFRFTRIYALARRPL